MEGTVRKATLADVRAIQVLVNDQARQGLMLGRSLSEIYECVRDYFVCVSGEDLLGTAALHIDWEDLAEIRSLAVREEVRRRGIGRRLVEACCREARELGLQQVFALTYQGEFFRTMGFGPVDKMTLPHKVWTDCLKCVKFPHCDEEAVLIHLDRERG
jgi:amino-acid N-acetyltransferase